MGSLGGGGGPAELRGLGVGSGEHRPLLEPRGGAAGPPAGAGRQGPACRELGGSTLPSAASLLPACGVKPAGWPARGPRDGVSRALSAHLWEESLPILQLKTYKQKLTDF